MWVFIGRRPGNEQTNKNETEAEMKKQILIGIVSSHLDFYRPFYDCYSFIAFSFIDMTNDQQPITN